MSFMTGMQFICIRHKYYEVLALKFAGNCTYFVSDTIMESVWSLLSVCLSLPVLG